jgi:hypothetical protein
MIFTPTALRLHFAKRAVSTCRLWFMCLNLTSFIIAGVTNSGGHIFVTTNFGTMGTKLWNFSKTRDLFQIYWVKNLK